MLEASLKTVSLENLGLELGCGGSFDFAECLKVSSFPSNGLKPQATLVNSFDIAVLTQLGMALLLSGAGDEHLNTNWVTKAPYGYLKPAMPIGLVGTDIPAIMWANNGVNNAVLNGLSKQTFPFRYLNGYFSLQTPHSILCMRNNLFIEISIVDIVAPDPAHCLSWQA